MHAWKKSREASKMRADGVVLVRFEKTFLDHHHPGAHRDG